MLASAPANWRLAVFTQLWIAWGLIALRVAGALKHQFDRHPAPWRMDPFARSR